MDLNKMGSHALEEEGSKKESIQELIDRLAKENMIESHMISPPEQLPPEDKMPLTNMNPLERCGCTNCVNRRSLLDLESQFENQRTRMITELGDLKSECAQVDSHSTQLNSRIEVLAEFTNSGSGILLEFQNEQRDPTGSLPPRNSHLTPVIPRPEVVCNAKLQQQNLGAGDYCPRLRKPSSSFQNDLGTLQKCRSLLGRKMTQLRSNGNSTESAGEDKHPILPSEDKPESEIQLEKAYENNQFMVEKIKQLETIVKALLGNATQTAHVPVTDQWTGTETDASTDENFAFQQLHAMKEAFETNRKLIMVQEERLHSQSMLISKYEAFVRDLHQLLARLMPDSTKTISENVDLSQTLVPLRDCIQQILADNGLMCKKLEAVRQVLQTANRENALLNETVVNLNDHIQELSLENDKLMIQFQYYHRDCRECGTMWVEPSQMPAETPPPALDKSYETDDDGRCPHTLSYRVDHPPLSSPQPPSPLSVPTEEIEITPQAHSPLVAGYVKNLQIMTKYLQDLKTNSAFILTTSLNLTPPPIQIYPEMNSFNSLSARGSSEGSSSGWTPE